MTALADLDKLKHVENMEYSAEIDFKGITELIHLKKAVIFLLAIQSSWRSKCGKYLELFPG